MFVTGGLHFGLDRPDNVNARKFSILFESYDFLAWFICRVNVLTHKSGALLDAVATHDDLVIPKVDVINFRFLKS